MDWLRRNKRLVLAGLLGFTAWFLAAYVLWLPQSAIWPQLGDAGPHARGGSWLGTGALAAMVSGWIAGLLSKRAAIPTGLAVAIPLVTLLILMLLMTGASLSMTFDWYRLALVLAVTPMAIAGAALVRRA